MTFGPPLQVSSACPVLFKKRRTRWLLAIDFSMEIGTMESIMETRTMDSNMEIGKMDSRMETRTIDSSIETRTLERASSCIW
jgi:hypothetical protein